MREQNCIRYIWYAESENEGPNIHKPKHYNTFDNVRRSTSQKHSDRNQSARAWDNEAPDTRLLTTSDKDPSKTACRCSNQSLRLTICLSCQPRSCSCRHIARALGRCSRGFEQHEPVGLAAPRAELNESRLTSAVAASL